jgi:hypothetical protein
MLCGHMFAILGYWQDSGVLPMIELTKCPKHVAYLGYRRLS